jgi:hypothetical protein
MPIDPERERFGIGTLLIRLAASGDRFERELSASDTF